MSVPSNKNTKLLSRLRMGVSLALECEKKKKQFKVPPNCSLCKTYEDMEYFHSDVLKIGTTGLGLQLDPESVLNPDVQGFFKI